MKEVAILAGFRGVFLPRLLALFYRDWQTRNSGGQGILLSTDLFWRNWSETAGIRVDDPENATWDASGPILWFLGEQARSAWPDFRSMPYAGDYFLLGQNLQNIQDWLPKPLPLSCGDHGLAFGHWRCCARQCCGRQTCSQQTCGQQDQRPTGFAICEMETGELSCRC